MSFIVLFFPSIGTEKSDPIRIATNEDSIVESEESFELALISSDIKISTATVWIRDNNCKIQGG